MAPLRKRLVTLAIIAFAGAATGWLSLNLMLDMLLGGSLF